MSILSFDNIGKEIDLGNGSTQKLSIAPLNTFFGSFSNGVSSLLGTVKNVAGVVTDVAGAVKSIRTTTVPEVVNAVKSASATPVKGASVSPAIPQNSFQTSNGGMSNVLIYGGLALLAVVVVISFAGRK